jgi:hypothetical protein
MKKIIIALSLLILLVGCTQEEKKEIKLFDNYPESILPLYKAESSLMNVFKKEDGVISHATVYVSKGTADEISEYYQSLMSTVDGEDSSMFDYTFFTGIIQNREASVYIFYNSEEKSYKVELWIEGTETSFELDSFIDFKASDLVEFYGLDKMTYESYAEHYDLEMTGLFYKYDTNITKEDFLSHYESLYSSKDEFAKMIDEDTIILNWKEQDYGIEVTFHDLEDQEYIEINIYIEI